MLPRYFNCEDGKIAHTIVHSTMLDVEIRRGPALRPELSVILTGLAVTVQRSRATVSLMSPYPVPAL